MPIRPLPFLPRSFRAQLALSFFVLGAGLAVLLAAVLGAMQAQGNRRDAGIMLQAAARNSARLLADGLDLRLREVTVLADSPTLWSEGLGSARVAQALYRSQAVNPYSAWIGVSDAQGVVRAATGGLLVGQSVATRPWFLAGLQGPYVGDVHPAKLLAKLLPPGSDGGPQRFVDFAAPIQRDGQLIGVLGIHGSWAWTRATIESLLPEAGQRKGLEVFVFDRAGTMIYAPETSLARHLQAGQTLPRHAQTAPTAEPDGPAVLHWQEGGEHLTVSAALASHGGASDLGWTVVARQPVAQAHAAARQGAQLALLLGLATALASALLGWWLAGRLTAPLRRIARDAQALDGSGPLQALPVLTSSHEVAQLSGALNLMTRRLLDANVQLEQRVQARTAELEQANAALGQLAANDPLTGLLNRRGLDERMAVAVAGARRRSAPLSLLLVDADHFKQVNDRHGHEVGDRVLQAIAQCLRKRVREADAVARIGGEEFVVLLPDTGSLGASHVAQALVHAVQGTPMPVAGQVTISCGVAEMDLDTETPDDVLRRADTALYQAKHSGRNRFCVAGAADMANAAEVPGEALATLA